MHPRISYWLLIVTLLLLPWYTIRFTFINIPFTLLEVSALATFAVWLIEEVALLMNSPHPKRDISGYYQQVKNNWKIVLFIGLFVISSIVSIFIVDDLRSALGIFKAYFFEPVLVFIVILRVVQTSKEWWGVIAALMLAGATIIGLTYTQWIWKWPNYAPSELSQGRTSAVYNTANAVGLFLGPLVILAAFTALYWYKQKKKKLAGILILFTLTGLGSILLSQSMGALVAVMLAFLAGLIVWQIAKMKNSWLKFSGMTALIGLSIYILGVISYMLWFNQPPMVANPYTRPGFSTFTIRQCTWEGTVAALEKSPLLGNGLAGFTPRYLENATCDAEPLVYPHNLVLNFWSEMGLLGLAAFFSLVGYWLVFGAKLIHDRKTELIGIGLCLGVVYWLIHGIVDVPYFKNDLSMEWWVMFGLVMVAGRRLLKTPTIN